MTSLHDLPSTPRMPLLFVGHGSPMNAIEDNAYSQSWRQLGATLPTPKAILCISAHWLTEGGTLIHNGSHPKTIHDFWGFPQELYTVLYPAPGSPDFAAHAKSIATNKVEFDQTWGLDHGAWSVLVHLFPKANIPVFQMSIDFSRHGDFHYEFGKELAILRDKGVLLLGSGNIVHNLGRVNFSPDAQPFDWAVEFDEQAKTFLSHGNDQSLISYPSLGTAAHLSIPTPDHYWPLLYILGAKHKDDGISYPTEGIAHGSVSMRSVLFS